MNVPNVQRVFLYVALLLGAGVGTVALLWFLPHALETARRLPSLAWVGIAATLAAGAVLFLVPQFRGWRAERGTGRLRSNLNVVVEQAVGSADVVLEARPQLDPSARDAHTANLVQVRLPQAGHTGKTKIVNNGLVSVVKPITAGMDLASAVEFAATEDPEIRAAVAIARDLVASEFPGTVPALVNTFGGLHFEKGTTFARTFAFQGDALSWPEAELSVVHLLHERNPHPPQSGGQNAGVQPTALGADEPQTREPRRNLAFPVPHRLRPGMREPASSQPRARSRRIDFPVEHRQDLLLKGLPHWAHGLVSLVRVNAVGDIARVDAKLRRAVGVAEVAAQWGQALGAGIETKRIPRDAGCGWFGSFSDDVYSVPSRAALTPTIQRLRLHGVRTLEGYDFVPGDREEAGRGRRVILFAYGAPELVRELPEVVRRALLIEPERFFPVAAGVRGCRGAQFVLFIEASTDELSEGRDAAYPALIDHPLWPAYMEAVDHWNTIKSDAPKALSGVN